MRATPPVSTIPADGPRPLPAAGAPQSLIVAGHQVTVFVEWPPLLESMIRDIQHATRRIWLETYIFHNDAGGTAVAEALIRKAQEGLDVRVLYDALGSAFAPADFFVRMQQAGVKLHAYHSFLEGLRRFRLFSVLNRRDHRKLLIVDDSAGYFGGMNIIDNAENPRPHKANAPTPPPGWRDVHIRLEGLQVGELAESFDGIWRRVCGQRAGPTGRAFRAQLRQACAADPQECIRFFETGSRSSPSRISRVFARLLRSARREVTISMAYFIPVGATLRALLRARRRGARIRVIVPGESDVKIVQRASMHLYHFLIGRGIRIYERQYRMLHSKVVVIDGLHTLVGSANLDPRSLYISLEFMAVIRSRNLARLMKQICAFEIDHSVHVTLAHCRRVSPWQRFVNRLAWSLRWWL